eukprot:TRINITY_DN3914_c0_g1_i2.p2 TRINITY_DN3914_c0_g1~~TRINITY_DN3914_c0_g1_i2.p2  ORF type:complete len:137 (-),score=9.37 TRINITY_DN3914_c0_g1_i2:90-500(-)
MARRGFGSMSDLIVRLLHVFSRGGFRAEKERQREYRPSRRSQSPRRYDERYSRPRSRSPGRYNDGYDRYYGPDYRRDGYDRERYERDRYERERYERERYDRDRYERERERDRYQDPYPAPPANQYYEQRAPLQPPQ